MDQAILTRTKELLQDIADILYKGNTQEGIAMMSQAIPDIAVISTWISEDEVQARLVEDALSPALEAMEEKDGTMLADIITYELLDILNTL